MDVRSASERKALSAFYTPPTLADALADWLVRTGCERILEPSVGEGSLIDAAARRSRAIHGVSRVRVLACDIDPHVIETVIPRLAPECDARAIDFLQLDPVSTGLFNGVLTNPPFTRNHSIDARRRAALRDRFGASGAAGLWLYFLLHALDFLMPGGRLAAVIPASGLFSDYGRAALGRVCRRFAQVEIKEFVDKPHWVNDADERGALFLAEGFGQGACALPRATRWSASGQQANEIITADAVFNRLLRQSMSLDGIAALTIGAVTGCNSIFLVNEEERRSMSIDRTDLRPVASRARHIPGLSINAAALIAQAQAGEKTWLLVPRSIAAKSDGVRQQLAKISAGRRRSTLWFAKRVPWWKVDVPLASTFLARDDRGGALDQLAEAMRSQLFGPDRRLRHIVFRVNIDTGSGRPGQVTAKITPPARATFNRHRFEERILTLLHRNGLIHDRYAYSAAFAAE